MTDSLLDRCKPIAGTPEDCIAAIEEYREAGCTHVMLELWGDRRHDQIRLFGEQRPPILSVVNDYDADAFDAYEQAGWESIAGRFAERWSPITSLAVDALLDAAHVGQGSRVLDVGTGAGDAAAHARPARRGGDRRRCRYRDGGDRGAAASGGDLRPGSGDRASVRGRLLRRGRRQQRHPAHRRARAGGRRVPTGTGSRRSGRADELGRSGALALLRSRTGSRRCRRGAVADRGARWSLVLPVHGRRRVPRAAGGRRLRGGRRRGHRLSRFPSPRETS